MQIIRTIVWVLVLVGLLLFSLNNWQTVSIKIWEDLILDTKLPVLVMISFLLGLLPMWLLHKGAKWRFNRRISALENSVRAATVSTPVVADERPVTAPDLTIPEPQAETARIMDEPSPQTAVPVVPKNDPQTPLP